MSLFKNKQKIWREIIMKYIFIDSNTYRHIFSRSEGFSDSIYKLLIKLTENERVIIIAADSNKALIEAVSTVQDFILVKYYRVKFSFDDSIEE